MYVHVYEYARAHDKKYKILRKNCDKITVCNYLDMFRHGFILFDSKLNIPITLTLQFECKHAACRSHYLGMHSL